MSVEKVKMSKKDFDELYDIIEDNTITTEIIKNEEPKAEEEKEVDDFLTEEQMEQEKIFHEDLVIPEEKE